MKTLFISMLIFSAPLWAGHIECTSSMLGLSLQMDDDHHLKPLQNIPKNLTVISSNHTYQLSPELDHHLNLNCDEVIAFHSLSDDHLKIEIDLNHARKSLELSNHQHFKTFIEIFKNSQAKGFRTEVDCTRIP